MIYNEQQLLVPPARSLLPGACAAAATSQEVTAVAGEIIGLEAVATHSKHTAVKPQELQVGEESKQLCAAARLLLLLLLRSSSSGSSSGSSRQPSCPSERSVSVAATPVSCSSCYC